MVRSAIGVLAGAIVWMVAFFVLARVLVLVWPDYAQHAQTWMSARTYDFTPAMSVANALFWVVAEIVAGWVAVVAARRREAAWVLAALVGLYLAYVHLYYMWNSLPKAYNLAVAIPAIPAVLLGGKIAERFVHRRPAVA